MRIRQILCAVIALASCWLPAQALAGDHGVNLLVNGDAVKGNFSTSGGPLPSPTPVPGWSTTGELTVVDYKANGDTSGFPKISDPGPPGSLRGNQFFAGGNSASSTASQIINISDKQADIDSGRVICDFYGWFGGYANQDDHASFSVTFEHQSGTTLSSAAIGPVTALDRGNQTSLLFREAHAAVAVGTRSIVASLDLKRATNSGYNDGYADYLLVKLRGPQVVTTTAFDGPGSIRDSIFRASYLTFDPTVFASDKGPQLIDLDFYLEVEGDTTIVGPGANLLTLRLSSRSTGDPIFIFRKDEGDTAVRNVQLSGLTLAQAKTFAAVNNNWKNTQQAEIQATTIPPSNDLESAIVTSLPANNSAYTAILSGRNEGTGIGLVEVYDLAQNSKSQLANISTRRFVDTGDNVMIGGVILGPSGSGAATVLVRGIGPSLSAAGVANALDDPTLELHDTNGITTGTNDNWKDTQQAEAEVTGIPPSDDRESGLVQLLASGSYTTIVRGKDDTTGVALVELYDLTRRSAGVE